MPALALAVLLAALPARAQSRSAPQAPIPALPAGAEGLSLPKAILFDWDGTIAKEIDAWHAVLKETSKRLGMPAPPADEVERTWVVERDKFFDRHFPGQDPALVKKTFRELMGLARGGALMDGRRFDGVELMPEAASALDDSKRRGVTLAVVSNKPQDQLDAELDKTGLSPYFALVQGHAEGREAKPSPQPILEALSALGVPAEQAWYVGNEPMDMEAAVRSGVRPVLMDPRWADAVASRHPEHHASGRISYVEGHPGLRALLRRSSP